MNAIHDDETDLPRALASVDLNLLLAFDALVEERSVTRAGERLFLTQSAMSHALRRLRQLLSDPLLVRVGGRMVPTPRAEALRAPIRGALVTLGRAVRGPVQFTPETAVRRFRIASPDLFDALVVPPLLARLKRLAPSVDLSVVPPAERTSEALETGELDLAVVPQLDDLGDGARSPATPDAPGLLRRRLLRDRFMCFVRRGHPAVAVGAAGAGSRGRISLSAYLAASHCLVSPGGHGRGVVDDILLQRRGSTRRVALSMPSFLSAIAIVARSDLVLTAPAALVTRAPRGVVSATPPVRLPAHSVHAVWHERFAADPAVTWLREQLVATAAELTW